MDNLSKEYIENFLNEFMLIEYKGKDHIVARAHYRETFNKIIPKYFERKEKDARINPKELVTNSGSKNIIIIGAGYGGLTAALRLERLFNQFPIFNIHLIDKYPFHTIKTQLHEAAIRKADVSIPLYKILKNKNIQFHLGEVKSIDAENKIIELEDKLLQFQFLIIAIGSKVNYYKIPGMEENSFPLQTLHDADKIYEHISKICANAASENNEIVRKENLRFVIGGGGLSGVEFAGELADHTARCVANFNIDNKDVEIIIIEAAHRLVPFMEESFSSRIERRLIEKGVRILAGSKIERRTNDEVFLSDGSIIKSKNFIWTGGIRISDLIKRGGLKTSSVGRLIVDEYLQAEDNKYIYAIGDSANAINPVTGKPIPAAAQFALQQGRLTAENIFAQVTGRAKKKYYP